MNIAAISVLKPNEEPILAGRLNGKRIFLRVLDELSALDGPATVILDFKPAEIATSSALSELVLPLRDHLRSRRPPAYVVVANLADKVAEELDDLLSRSGEAILACNFSKPKNISKARLFGRLDPKLLETFEMIRRKGETSAVELHDESAGNGIGPTGWNNRLAALASKSLVMETSHGRTKKYRPVLEIA